MTFRDLNVAGDQVYRETAPIIRPDGTRLDVVLPDYVVTDLLGPVEVKVEHADQVAIAPKPLEIATFELIELSPDRGTTGQQMTLNGHLFETDPSMIAVIFSDTDFQNVVRVEGSEFLTLSQTEIYLRAPALPGSKQWNVKVTQGPAGFELDSQKLPYFDAAFVLTDSPSVGEVGDTISLSVANPPLPLSHAFRVFFENSEDGTVRQGTLVSVSGDTTNSGEESALLRVIVPEGEGFGTIVVELDIAGVPEQTNKRNFSYITGKPFVFADVGRSEKGKINPTVLNESGTIATAGSTWYFLSRSIPTLDHVIKPAILTPDNGVWNIDENPADGFNDLLVPFNTYDTGLGEGGGWSNAINNGGDVVGRAAHYGGGLNKAFSFRAAYWPSGSVNPVDMQAKYVELVEPLFPGKNKSLPTPNFIAINDDRVMVLDTGALLDYDSNTLLLLPGSTSETRKFFSAPLTVVCHLVPDRQLPPRGQVDLDHLQHARRKLVPALHPCYPESIHERR